MVMITIMIIIMVMIMIMVMITITIMIMVVVAIVIVIVITIIIVIRLAAETLASKERSLQAVHSDIVEEVVGNECVNLSKQINRYVYILFTN